MSFDRLSQRIADQVVRPWFFFLVLGAILAWIPTLFLWDVGPSDLLVDSLTNPLSLLLLVLLQNTQSRQEKAQDSRQDEVELGLALLLRHVAREESDEAHRRKLCDLADELVKNSEASTRLATAGERGQR